MDVLVTAQLIGVSSVLEREDAAPQTFGMGQCVCLAAGIRHRMTVISPDEGLSQWSHLRCQILGGVDVMALISVPMVLNGSTSCRIGELNRTLTDLKSQGRSDWSTVARRQATAMAIFAALCEEASARSDAVERLRALERLVPLIAHIDASLETGTVRVPALAAVMGVSPTRLHELFRTALGRSPARYVQDRRLDRARMLLIGTELPVATVAARSGYGDAFHFCRLFHRRMGISPSGFRRTSALASW